MRKISKFLLAGGLLLTGFLGITNTRNEVKEVDAASFVEGEKLYFNGGESLWDQADAWFVAHLFNSSTNAYSDVKFEAVDGHDGYYSYTFTAEDATKEFDKVKFIRMNPEATGFGDIWNTTDNLQWNASENFAFEEGKDLFTITEWHVGGDDSKGSNGVWSKYIFNPTNIFQAVQTVENDDSFNNSAKFVGALPKGTQAAKNSNDEYNVGFKFEFERSWEETVTTTTEAVVENMLYLKPNSNWTQSNARFAVYTWDGGDKWYDMTYDSTLSLYKVEIPTSRTNIIFCRMNPSTTTNNWNNKWNQTSDLKFDSRTTKNTYTVASGTWDSGGGTWSLTKEKTSAGSTIIQTEVKLGYYTCANLTSVKGFDSSVVPFEVEVYFAVVVSDIPAVWNGGLVRVTPAYQDLNETTIYGPTAVYSIAIGATGVTLSIA